MSLGVFLSAMLRLCVCWEETQVCLFLLWEGNPRVTLIGGWGAHFCLASLTEVHVTTAVPKHSNRKPYKVSGFVAAGLGHISLNRIAVIEKSLIPALILSFPTGCLYTVCLFSIQPHESLFCHHHSFCEAPQRFLGQVKSLFSLQ